jgi:hypothetical protein
MKSNGLEESVASQRPLIYVAVAIAGFPMLLLGLLDIRSARLSASWIKILVGCLAIFTVLAVLMRASWGAESDSTLFASVGGAVFSLILVNVAFMACARPKAQDESTGESSRKKGPEKKGQSKYPFKTNIYSGPFSGPFSEVSRSALPIELEGCLPASALTLLPSLRALMEGLQSDEIKVACKMT